MRRLAVPSILLLSFFGYLALRGQPPGGDGAWLPASRVAFGVVFLLAWRLRRGKIAWAAAALAASTEALGIPGVESEDLLLGLGLLLPLGIGVTACLPEWWVTSKPGLLRWIALGLGGGAVYGFTLPGADTLAEAITGWGSGGAGAATAEGLVAWSSRLAGWASSLGATSLGAPPAVLLAGVSGLGLCALALRFRKTSVEAGLAGSLVAAALAYGDPDRLRYYAAAAALVLGAALVENAFNLAFHDGLTGLPARRALEERLSQVGRTYALAMLDLDHFKKFNDKHGHEVGDQVLQLVASRLRGVTGGGEAFRYGGEEFTVVFPGCGAGEAKAHMDALREDIAGRKFTVRSPGRPSKKPKGPLPRRSPSVTKELKVTVSVGVAERSAKYPAVEDVMKAADKALYQSKKAGRNRVTVAK